MKKYFLIGLGAFGFLALMIAFWVMFTLSGLPDVAALKRYRPPAASEVLDKDGKLVTTYYDHKFRIWVPIANINHIVIQAVVIAEDDTFFEHKGVNYKATREALFHDLQKRRFARGGSTITQQMIKNVFLSKEKTISRKLREYVLATRAEEILTKQQILQIYLNEVEWGDNIYGIEAASRFYLDKHASELTPAEAALLAGMLPNPRYYNPIKRPEKARARQERVLFNMQQAKIITPEEYNAALAAPLKFRQENGGKLFLSDFTPGNGRPCYQHALEQTLLALFNEHDLYRSGKTIRTTLDKSLQAELAQINNGASTEKESAIPGKILAVKQGNSIRALVCGADKEKEVRDKIGSLGFLFAGYEVSMVAPDSITREQIVLPETEVK